jgi:hypothetical protein
MLPSSPQVAAGMLVLGAIALGWFAMWRLVLRKVPIVRAMFNLPQLVQKQKPS